MTSRKVRRYLVAAVVIGALVLVLGAVRLTAGTTGTEAQALSGSCAPYDSSCVYCQNHPTADICPPTKPAPAPPVTTPAATMTAAATATATPSASATVIVTTAAPTSTPAGCMPYDSSCIYCMAHPTSSVCKP